MLNGRRVILCAVYLVYVGHMTGVHRSLQTRIGPLIKNVMTRYWNNLNQHGWLALGV
jgi:hypothetical protein